MHWLSRLAICMLLLDGSSHLPLRLDAFETPLHSAPSSVSLPVRPPASDAVLDVLLPQAPGLRSEVLRLALDAQACAQREGRLERADLLTVIDYSLPSTEARLWVFHLEERKLLLHDLVAHGRNSGENLTQRFSNKPGSLQTSLGLFVTANPYNGGNGYSLRLRGLEPGFNDRALERAIVVHGAAYVSAAAASRLGRLGRSWGCPAVSRRIARKLIDEIRGGSALFAYYPDKRWLRESQFLSGCRIAR